jgi:PAS domain-containing protein
MDYKELCCKIIDSHDGLVYVTDMETNEVIFANKKLLQVIGKNKAEVFGKPYYQLRIFQKYTPCRRHMFRRLF